MHKLGLAVMAACLVWAGVNIAFADGDAAPRFETVYSVYDGDTFKTRESGTVRLLGIDTPEMRPSAGRLTPWCPLEGRLAVEARDKLRDLVGLWGKDNGVALRRVANDRGVLQPNVDRYKRLLRGGTNRDGVDLKEAMLAARSTDGRVLAVPYWGRGAKRDWCSPSD